MSRTGHVLPAYVDESTGRPFNYSVLEHDGILNRMPQCLNRYLKPLLVLLVAQSSMTTVAASSPPSNQKKKGFLVLPDGCSLKAFVVVNVLRP
jgi:hypothetical protein